LTATVLRDFAGRPPPLTANVTPPEGLMVSEYPAPLIF
jgi:hypothetical protein